MSEQYWESLYQAGDLRWDKGEASPGLVDFLASHKLEKGTVCVPGCGTGHDVRAWAAAGFDVYGFDLAPSGIRLAREKTEAAGLRAHFQHGDFLRDTLPRQFDWIFEHTLFCAIQPSERDAYVEAALRWLKPGGHFLAVNYFIPDTDGPPFGTDREEQLRRFSAGFELLEDWVPRSYPNRTGLERMFWWRKKLRVP
ncbi:MAG TPA: methyltransferase domain-containing protein [Verrucomicrobiae bacterium]|nr:methyltransferase domain-containing protein [Verrucomicrobiae bacterium]